MQINELIGYAVAVLVAALGSSWLGDLLKARRERKAGTVTTKQIMAELKDLRADFDEEKAIQARARIVTFNDAIISGQKRTKESYDIILADIDAYERYCRNNPHFENNKTRLTTENIKKAYLNNESNGFNN